MQNIPEALTHPFGPVVGPDSEILILGSFPSVKSREEGFYYGHPRNRFWKIMTALTKDKGIAVPEAELTIPEKKRLILDLGLALWDVCASCVVTGSSDSSIRSAVPNDIPSLIASAPIRAVITNGKTADALYKKLILRKTGITPICLPSTSPANAAWTLKKLTEEWRTAIYRV